MNRLRLYCGIVFVVTPVVVAAQVERVHRIVVDEIPSLSSIGQSASMVDLLLLSLIGRPMLTMASPSSPLEDGTLDAADSLPTSGDYSSFRLCLASRLRFSDGNIPTEKDLQATVLRIHKSYPMMYGSIKKTSISGKCLDVVLDKSNFDYLELLINPITALIRVGENSIPVSTGVYSISSFSGLKVELESADVGVKDLKKIEIAKNEKDLCDGDCGQLDWNYYGNHKNAYEKMFQNNHANVLKSMPAEVFGFSVNIGDGRLRRIFSHCLYTMKDDIISIVNDNSRDGHFESVDHRNLIPFPYKGWIEKSAFREPKGKSGECQALKGKKFTLMDNDRKRLQSILALFKERKDIFPLEIKGRFVQSQKDTLSATDDSDSFSLFFSRPTGGFGPGIFHSLGYLKNFIDLADRNLVQMKDFSNVFSKSIESKSLIDRELYLKKSQQILVENGIAVPIGVRYFRYYLPKIYGDVSFISQFFPIPRYDLIEVSENRNEMGSSR